MTNRTSIIMGGMAAAIALTAAGGASAATTTPLYGGGSTLVEKVYRDLFNAYGSTSAGDLCAGLTSATKACPNDPYNAAVELLYVGVGSGNGLKALDGYSASALTGGTKTPDSVPTPSGHDFGAFFGAGFGTKWVPSATATNFYPSMTFAGSDNTLAQSDLDTAKSLGFGPLIQIPGVVAAIAVPFHPTAGWKPSGVQPKGGSSKVQLSTNTLCGIYTGAITTWNNAAITKDNKGVVLGTGKITVVYRNDSSGTTFIFTNALLNQCGTAAHKTKSTHPIPAQWLKDNGITAAAKAPFYHSGTSFFINVFNAKHLPANFLNNEKLTGVTGGASGSGGVKTAIAKTVGSIGYVSPDFVLPVDTTGSEAANLQTYASFSAGKTPVYVAPTPANATAAMAAAAPPVYTKNQPLTWGGVAPTPTAVNAYPASGFSFIDLYTCYKSAAVVNALVSKTAKKAGYLTWYYGATSINKGVPASILAADGFAPVPLKWTNQINALLSSPTLGISTVGTKACAKVKKGA